VGKISEGELWGQASKLGINWRANVREYKTCMARPYRIEVENCLYHITNRGDGKRNIYQSEYDHLKFLGYLLKAKERYKFYVYAYVLMSNHYHLLIKTLQPNLSKIMHYINSSYTKYSNIKRNKVNCLKSLQ
jgi:putative transposase